MDQTQSSLEKLPEWLMMTIDNEVGTLRGQPQRKAACGGSEGTRRCFSVERLSQRQEENTFQAEELAWAKAWRGESRSEWLQFKPHAWHREKGQPAEVTEGLIDQPKESRFTPKSQGTTGEWQTQVEGRDGGRTMLKESMARDWAPASRKDREGRVGTGSGTKLS